MKRSVLLETMITKYIAYGNRYRGMRNMSLLRATVDAVFEHHGYPPPHERDPHVCPFCGRRFNYTHAVYTHLIKGSCAWETKRMVNEAIALYKYLRDHTKYASRGIYFYNGGRSVKYPNARALLRDNRELVKMAARA